ncbi:MAG: hypothetical protein QOJ96_3130 [Alphaproteobacteria bacterium]|jgi:PAS domain S-box-containing protein|nr:hypothetical protein [Alphaproteobacteria bacterium]
MQHSAADPSKPLIDAQRFQLLVDAVTDHALYMLDPDGFVTSWNSGAHRIKGYVANEILGQHFSRFFTREDQAAGLPAQILDQAKTTGHFESEGLRVRKDGSRFWGQATIHAIRNETGELIGFAKVTRDITERRAAYDALVESERRFRLLVEGVMDYAIYMLDPSGMISNWNAGAQRLKGYHAGEIVGQHFSRFYTKEDRTAGLPARVLEAAAREGRYESEGWRVRKDGTRFWASAVVDAIRTETGELVGFAKVTRDITEQQAAQNALRESERQFRLLVAGVTDYALYMLDRNGVITNWNAGAQRIKGYAADEVVGQHFSRFYVDAERTAGMPARALRIAEEEGRYEAEGWRMRKDGSQFWANVIIDPIFDDDRHLIGFAKITRDITERREAQIALEQAQAQRARAQKMEALGQLTGGVAHDFNNLLMIVGGHIQTIKKLVADDPRGARAAEAIETAAKRGESLTRQMLTFARRQTFNRTVIDVGEVVRGFGAMLANTIGASARLVTNVLPDVWPVKIDVNEFELALVNVVLNARDAMPQGGLITVTAENAQVSVKDTPEGIEGEFVAITVADTGSGIAPDILPKIFDPFFTTKAVNSGTGLGLSQVHGFAHQSGGTVTVQSVLGKGTSITLYLPCSQAQPAEGEAESVSESSSGGTVLLVEDNPDVADVSAALLKQLGYRVHVAGNAEAALQALEQEKFDLVVSDIVMAGSMDGVSLARAIRQRIPNLPIVLVTGYSNAAAGAAAEFPVLRKPYQIAELSRVTAKVMSDSRRPPPDNLVRLSDAGLSKQRKPKQP